jgi:hypothetical protein
LHVLHPYLLAKIFKRSWLSLDLKISLLSKYRAEAVSRNATVTLVIKKVLELVTNDTTPEIFKREVNREVNDVRLSFSSPEHNNVPTRDVGLAKLENPQESVSKGILLSDALDGFIQSKSKESIRALTVWQLKQRTAHFINATSSQYVSDITSASALKYRDVLLEEDRSVKSNKEYLAAVSQFFKWCCIMEYTGANLFVNIRLNQKKKIVTIHRVSDGRKMN